MPKLYELEQEYAELQYALDVAPDEEVRAIIESAMTVTVENMENVVEYLIKLQRNYESDSFAYKSEKDHFAKKQKSAETKAENLKKFIEEKLLLLGYNGDNKKKLQAGLYTAFLQYNAPKLVIAEDAEIPQTYYKPQLPVLDRVALLEAVKLGSEIAGVYTEQSQSIRIK